MTSLRPEVHTGIRRSPIERVLSLLDRLVQALLRRRSERRFRRAHRERGRSYDERA